MKDQHQPSTAGRRVAGTTFMVFLFTVTVTIQAQAQMAPPRCDVVLNGDQNTEYEFSVRKAVAHMNRAWNNVSSCAPGNWEACQFVDAHVERAQILLHEVFNDAVSRGCWRCDPGRSDDTSTLIGAAAWLESMDYWIEYYSEGWMRRRYGNTFYVIRDWFNLNYCPAPAPAPSDAWPSTPTVSVPAPAEDCVVGYGTNRCDKDIYYVVNVSGSGHVPHWGGGSFIWSGDRDQIVTVRPGQDLPNVLEQLKKELAPPVCSIEGPWGWPGALDVPQIWDSGPDIKTVWGPIMDLTGARNRLVRNNFQRLGSDGPNLGELRRRAGC